MTFKKISDLYYQCENGSRNVAVLLFHSRRLMCLIRKNGVLVPCHYPCSLSPVNCPATYPRACFPRSGAAIATFPVPVSGPFLYTARLFIQAAFISVTRSTKWNVRIVV